MFVEPSDLYQVERLIRVQPSPVGNKKEYQLINYLLMSYGFLAFHWTPKSEDGYFLFMGYLYH